MMALSCVIFNISRFCFTRNQNRCQTLYLKKHVSSQNIRLFSDKPQSFAVETDIQNILRKSFPSAQYIEVRDVSGGCGAMFEISVITEEFKGLTVIKQHRLVNEALKEQIKDMHGLRIHTALPSASR